MYISAMDGLYDYEDGYVFFGLVKENSKLLALS